MKTTRAIQSTGLVSTDCSVQPEVPPKGTPDDVGWPTLVHEPDAVDSAKTLDEWFAEIERMPHKRLTKEEVDRYLAEERESWE